MTEAVLFRHWNDGEWAGIIPIAGRMITTIFKATGAASGGSWRHAEDKVWVCWNGDPANREGNHFPQNMRKKWLETYIYILKWRSPNYPIFWHEVYPIDFIQYHEVHTGHSMDINLELLNTFPNGQVFLFLRDLYTNIVWILATKIRFFAVREGSTAATSW